MTLRLKAIWVLVLCLFPGTAHAGVIKLSEQVEVAVEWSGEAGRLRGTYSLRNDGTETAYRSFPSFAVGKLRWQEAPRDIRPGRTEQWAVDVPLSGDQLMCPGGKDCPAADHSLTGHLVRGTIPLYSLSHYEDSSGRKFSAPAISELILGPEAPQRQGNAEIRCHGDGQRFQCLLILERHSAEQLRVVFHHSQEMVVEPSSITLVESLFDESTNEFKVPFSIQNISGLPGSSYAVLAAVQWEKNGVSAMQRTASTITIKRVRYPTLYIWIAAVTLLLGVWQFRRILRNCNRSVALKES